jgi:hypothetical protein
MAVEGPGVTDAHPCGAVCGAMRIRRPMGKGGQRYQRFGRVYHGRQSNHQHMSRESVATTGETMSQSDAIPVRDEASRIIVDELLQLIHRDLPHIRRHVRIEDDVESLRRWTDEFGTA